MCRAQLREFFAAHVFPTISTVGWYYNDDTAHSLTGVSYHKIRTCEALLHLIGFRT